jgi:CxxC motif-containing protein (DUF1111 family)
MEFYLLNYFKPATGNQTTEAQAGRALLTTVGCTTCHIPNLTINHDRRVADVETVFDPVAGGPFNQLFATATGLFTAVNDGTANPPLKNPTGGSFVVRNFFADLKRHDLGPNFRERNFDGTFQNQFMTEPLWGVATTAPYGHDGRSNNLEQVILRHGGEAQASRDAFAALSRANKMLIFEFLSTLVLFPPDDTSSNLLPANPAAANFPQAGHGAISLTVLFNTPSDIE